MWQLNSRWREIRACNDNTCGESKGQNSHDSLLDLTFLLATTDPKAPIYWYLISRQRLSITLKQVKQPTIDIEQQYTLIDAVERWLDTFLKN